jgi:branched-chain amino acid transport system ATP-binding protein
VLGKRMSQQAGTMSGGEQQMLSMARAIMQRPKVILVDEASLGLAPRVVELIFDFLQKLSRSGVSLILVDQLVSEALALASYAHILHKGELLFSGTPSELDQGEMFRQYLGGA